MIEKIMKIMREHGLYVVQLTSQMIGLTDKDGNVYDVVVVTDDGGLIIDENTTMPLAAWLGY